MDMDMDTDTDTEKFDIIRCIFDFAISHRIRDKKGSGVFRHRVKLPDLHLESVLDPELNAK